MERRQVDLLSVNELVVGDGPQVFDVVNEDHVIGSMMREEDDLCPSSCKVFGDCCSNTRGTTLNALASADTPADSCLPLP